LRSLVVSAVVGSPLTVKQQSEKVGGRYLDYFSFCKYSGLPIKSVTCWEQFKKDFSINRAKYNWLYEHLNDKTSKEILIKLLNFRLSADLRYMEGFKNIQEKQYFEDFLILNHKGETFVDVGGFEGETSVEFMKYCPEYKKLHFFEPKKKKHH